MLAWTRKHQDWFEEADKEIQGLLEKKRSCHNHLLPRPDDQAAKAAYKTACRTIQAKFKTMQNDWWTGLAERTQRYVDMGDLRASYEALKAVYGPSRQIRAPLLFGWKYPANRRGSHPPALVRAFRRPLQ